MFWPGFASSSTAGRGKLERRREVHICESFVYVYPVAFLEKRTSIFYTVSIVYLRLNFDFDSLHPCQQTVHFFFQAWDGTWMGLGWDGNGSRMLG